MKQITDFTVKHVISEPGDHTRYDYLVFKDYDEYKFISYGSTFEFPQQLNYFDVMDIDNIDKAIDYIRFHSKVKDINPHTLLECVNTIKELHG